MLYFNGKAMNFNKYNLRKRSETCLACSGELKAVNEYNYDEFCPDPACNLVDKIPLPKENDITLKEFSTIRNEWMSQGKDQKSYALIDVRPDHHFKIVHLDEAVSIPFKKMQKTPEEALKICSEHEKVYIMCRRGNASR